MLVVSIGIFKAGKEGISWKGALRALESWQCCLFSVGQIGNSSMGTAGQPGQVPKAMGTGAHGPHWGLWGPHSRCSLAPLVGAASAPIWNRKFEPEGVKIPLASQILDPWPDWVARSMPLAVRLPSVTQCVAYPRGRILGVMTPGSLPGCRRHRILGYRMTSVSLKRKHILGA